MKVKELIHALLQFDPETKVVLPSLPEDQTLSVGLMHAALVDGEKDFLCWEGALELTLQGHAVEITGDIVLICDD